MKKIFIILFVVATSLRVSAQSARDITLEKVQIEKTGDQVDVTFKALIGKKATKEDYKLILTPVIYQGSQSQSLTPIVVETRTTKIMDARERISAGKKASKTKPEQYATTTQSVVDYSVRIPYKEWMNGGNLRMDRRSYGCCDEANFDPLLMANALALLPPPAPLPPVEKPVVVPQPRKLHQWKFSKKDMIIDFSVSRTHIDLALFENESILKEVIEVVNKIKASSSASIDKIEITGYASPEGSLVNNKRLGRERAAALKGYIQNNITGLPDSVFNTRNGAENWDGLREMVVASEMPYKQQVLQIIDTVPIEVINNNSRKKALMDLKGGRPYLYMLEHFFPKLRNACYIGVYYLDGEETIEIEGN